MTNQQNNSDEAFLQPCLISLQYIFFSDLEFIYLHEFIQLQSVCSVFSCSSIDQMLIHTFRKRVSDPFLPMLMVTCRW